MSSQNNKQRTSIISFVCWFVSGKLWDNYKLFTFQKQRCLRTDKQTGFLCYCRQKQAHTLQGTTYYGTVYSYFQVS